MNEPLSPVPIIHNGDSYIVSIVQLDETSVGIVCIIRYPRNQNGIGELWKFNDLVPDEKKSIINAITKKHPRQIVKVPA